MTMTYGMREVCTSGSGCAKPGALALTPLTRYDVADSWPGQHGCHVSRQRMAPEASASVLK